MDISRKHQPLEAIGMGQLVNAMLSKACDKHLARLSALLLGVLPGTILAMPVPLAETESALTVSIGLEHVRLTPDRLITVWADSQTKTAALAIDATGAPSGHIGVAEASAFIRETVKLGGVGDLRPTETLYEIRFDHLTRAESFRNGPLAGQATAQSWAGLNNMQLEPIPGSTIDTPSLNLDWNIDNWGIHTQPSATFAMMRHDATIVQTLRGPDTSQAAQTIENTVGFITLSEDGRTRTAIIEGGASNATWHWPNLANAEIDGIKSAAMLDGLSVEIPVSGAPRLVDITVSHLEYSAEAPLSAVRRVAEQAGSIQSDSNENRQIDTELGLPKMRWDPADKTLTFDALPINVLSNNAEEHIAKHYQDDPLAGGTLEIDPLVYLEMLDGGGYFVGDGVRLLDRHGEVLFSASLPGLVYDHDDALFALDGFNMFAPLLNTSSPHDAESVWLRRFDDHLQSELLRLPELFIGFSGQELGEDPWSSAFEAAPNAVLSFAGLPIPLPGTPALVVLGLMILSIWRSARMTPPR